MKLCGYLVNDEFELVKVLCDESASPESLKDLYFDNGSYGIVNMSGFKGIEFIELDKDNIETINSNVVLQFLKQELSNGAKTTGILVVKGGIMMLGSIYSRDDNVRIKYLDSNEVVSYNDFIYVEDLNAGSNKYYQLRKLFDLL